MKLSVIIPSLADPYLHKTIDSLLENSTLGNDMEIVVILDGCWIDPPIKIATRIKILHLGKNRGMRGAINAGVRMAQGEYIMRADEHCMFGKGYDSILTADCSDNCIVTARRYFLNPETWTVMDKPYVDYCDLAIRGHDKDRKFTGVTNDKLKEQRKDIAQEKTFAMQGSMWLMKRSWWDKVIGSLQTQGYGQLIQDSHEMVFKTWKAGGKLLVNKKTWYAHKDRSFPRVHNNGTVENPANCSDGYKYALDTWELYFNELTAQGFFKYE